MLISEFEARMFYGVSSRTDKVYIEKPCPEKLKIKNKQNNPC